MRELRAQLEPYARSLVSVRIEGETGVGKELVARALHEASERRAGPFVALNCGALPEGLAEVELFGHVRGAYTGAVGERVGLVGEANGGTLMLDEVEDLPSSMQGKLLRLLQEGGGTVRWEVEACAWPTFGSWRRGNRSLVAMVEEGAFRRDLFYRLDVLRMPVPPLRDRLTDLPELVAHFVGAPRARGAGLAAGPVSNMPPAWVLTALAEHDWPGNVRELQNFVERARAIASASGWPDGWHRATAALPLRQPPPPPEPRADPEVDGERMELESLLSRHRWHRTAVARELGVSRVTLWRRMRRCGLVRGS